MEVREIGDKNTWEGFFEYASDKTFLQSWAWGEFQERMGNKIWRLGVRDGDRLAGASVIVKVRAKRGTFLMVQHLAPMGKEVFTSLFEEMKRIGARERASFIRMAPLWERIEENKRMFREFGFREAAAHANAYEATWKLALGLSEEELLANTRKTTRYLIRQTQKNKDITIKKSVRREDLDVFAALTMEVGKRQQFVPFSKKYAEAEFDALAEDGKALLIFGKYKEKVVAAAFVVFWFGIAFYHQAASLGEYAKYSVPYLVQWEAIKEAKRRGCTLYDFWGYVDPKKYPKHPWSGPTLFKMGFGGKPYEYVKTQDYPLSWKYWPTAIFESFRKRKRRV